MPASAGRVRMPHNNRLASSGALRTNDIWSKTIGYDPYKSQDDGKVEETSNNDQQTAGLMLLARMTNVSGSESRGGCKRCGMLGHLTFQCRNPVQTAAKEESESTSSSSDEDDEDYDSDREVVVDPQRGEVTHLNESTNKRGRNDGNKGEDVVRDGPISSSSRRRRSSSRESGSERESRPSRRDSDSNKRSRSAQAYDLADEDRGVRRNERQGQGQERGGRPGDRSRSRDRDRDNRRSRSRSPPYRNSRSRQHDDLETDDTHIGSRGDRADRADSGFRRRDSGRESSGGNDGAASKLQEITADVGDKKDQHRPSKAESSSSTHKKSHKHHSDSHKSKKSKKEKHSKKSAKKEKKSRRH